MLSSDYELVCEAFQILQTQYQQHKIIADRI